MTDTALLVIDMVYDFTNPQGRVFYPQNQEILPALCQLLAACRERELLIIFMQQRYRADKPDQNLAKMRPCCIEDSGGEEIETVLQPDPKKDYIIPKRRYSSFFGTDLDLVLREHGIKRLLITGTKTNCCVNATVLDAHYLCYDTVVVKDCVGTSDQLTNEIYLRDMAKYMAQVISLEEVLTKLRAGEWR